MKPMITPLFVALIFLGAIHSGKAAAPTKTDIEKAMRTAWEKPGVNGNPKITLDINSVKIGKSAPANEQEIVDGIPRGAEVTFALIDFTVRTHDPRSTQAVRRVREARVYMNALDEWKVMTGQPRGEDQRTEEPPSK